MIIIGPTHLCCTMCLVFPSSPSCPGSKVNRTKLNMALVKCVQKDMFLLNTTRVDIEQLMLVSKGEGCGPELTGQISQLGFQFG